jgi:SulP family sulfate permease
MLAPHFTPCALDRLLALLDVRELGAGQPVFRQGEPGDAVYFVERGRVAVLLPLAGGRSLRLRSYGPGTIVGEMAVYTQQARSADVLAEEPARVRRLTLESLRALEHDDPVTAQQFHRFVVKVMASRLAVADEALRAFH